METLTFPISSQSRVDFSEVHVEAVWLLMRFVSHCHTTQ